MSTRPAPAAPTGRSRSSNPSSTGGSSSRSGPARIGSYIIGRTLGSGSFGKVKMAEHYITGHQVALKFINRKKINLTGNSARVKREIQYLKVLRHPHIIKLYEVITTPNDVVMVMEYAGEELFTYIVETGKGGMSEADARRLFQQIIAAIEYCHKHNIAHRDLKPENLLLDSRDPSRRNVKIGDFGLCNLMTDGDFLKTSCGSPNYAAPEVIGGKLYSGPEIDVWSAGVIMYVLLCGRLPFDEDQMPMLFRRIEMGRYDMPSTLSDGAKHLIRRMLTVDPVKRATIAEIRAMPFFQVDLPQYLQPLPEVDSYPVLPMDDLTTLLMINQGQTDPKRVAEAKGLIFTEDLGILDPEIVAELVTKMSSYSEKSVWEALQMPLQTEGENQIKIAYQLVRDHKRILKGNASAGAEGSSAMEGFMAASPPAWNYERRQQQPRDDDMSGESEDDDDIDIQDIPNAHFDVLDTSRSTELPTRPLNTLIPNAHEKVIPKPKWHFGIRSRSPPMEVMLEIYKSLASLGMEWKKKETIEWPEIGPRPDGSAYSEEVETLLEQYEEVYGQPHVFGGYRPDKKAESDKEKAAQNLFIVETRHRYGNVIVRMDLQLYRVDAENFLVDFKNIGYYHANEREMQIPEAGSGMSSSHGSAKKGESIGGVSGPFHFLEMACQLIHELAG